MHILPISRLDEEIEALRTERQEAEMLVKEARKRVRILDAQLQRFEDFRRRSLANGSALESLPARAAVNPHKGKPKTSDQVLATLRQHPEGLRRIEILDALAEAENKGRRHTIRGTLSYMVKTGRLIQDRKGQIYMIRPEGE